MLLHATCVAIEDQGVLLTGEPGSGKSDVALRLIDQGAMLVADDMTKLRLAEEQLIATPPQTIAGLMEVRHLGILRFPFQAAVCVALYVELVQDGKSLDRMPDLQSYNLLDHPVPALRLPAFDASTPAKIRARLRYPFAPEDEV